MKKPVLIFSLFVINCLTAAGDADAALRIGNSGTGRGGTYSATQFSSVSGSSQTVSTQEMIESAKNSEELSLPVRVADMDMARAIARGQTYNNVSRADLDACAAADPKAAFAWDTPNAGAHSTIGCVADVEMRLYEGGTDDIILARARVSAGDSFNCNISSFPPEGYTAEAGNVEFPADREPTMEDVIKAMNQEQKQNAGLKIAAAALIGGLGGNFIGQNDPGKTGALGASGDKLKKTAIGAIALGGLTAVSTQAGKVGGDTIMGATVNAVGGGLIGNISGIGNPVLLIRKCQGTDCLYGSVSTGDSLVDEQHGFWGSKGTMLKCKEFKSNSTPVPSPTPSFVNCEFTKFSKWTINDAKCGDGSCNNNSDSKEIGRYISTWGGDRFCKSGNQLMKANHDCGSDNEIFYKLQDKPTEISNTQAAVIVGWDSKLSKYDDFKKYRSSKQKADIRYRNSGNEIGKPVDAKYNDIANFLPVMQDATDGSIIDLNNKARTTATATGAGIGASIGGFSAYQGAKDDVANRWLAEAQEYKDSLDKIYCATGGRHLSSYNDISIIPSVK